MKLLIISLLIVTACGKSSNSKSPFMEKLNGKPAILVIGDSISGGYMKQLKKEFPLNQVIHNNGNARHSSHGVLNIQSWVNWAPQWEVCTLNHGIHDTTNGDRFTDIPKYLENLEFEINVLRFRCFRILFINTTQDQMTGTDRAIRIPQYNQAAEGLMQSLGIPVCDLYSVSLTQTHNLVDAVHYNQTGSRALGQAVADCIDNL